MMQRTRVTSATVYLNANGAQTVGGVSWGAGNDGNDGETPATPLKTIQRAFDYASANFDLAPPFAWQPINPAIGSYIGERPGVVVQMAPAPPASPYTLPQPAYIDGLGCSGPITLRGDPSSPAAAAMYMIQADNPCQGLTAQNGGRLICDGFAIIGDPNCTLINTLSKGSARIRNVWFGQKTFGACPAGAAGGSQLEIDGPIWLWGNGGFAAVLTAIEEGRLILAPGHSINISNAMNYGIMINLMHASAWTEGMPPVFGGAGLAGSTGKKLAAFYNAFLGFDHTLIPGTYNPAVDQDATSVVL